MKNRPAFKPPNPFSHYRPTEDTIIYLNLQLFVFSIPKTNSRFIFYSL